MSRRAFFASFAKLRRDVVRPVFQEVLPILRSRGYRCEIHEEEFAARPGEGSTEASISLCLEHCELSFSTRGASRRIAIVNDDAAPRASVEIACIDNNRVEDEVLKLMAATVQRP